MDSEELRTPQKLPGGRWPGCSRPWCGLASCALRSAGSRPSRRAVLRAGCARLHLVLPGPGPCEALAACSWISGAPSTDGAAGLCCARPRFVPRSFHAVSSRVL